MGGDGGLAGPLGFAAAAPAKAPTGFTSLPSSPASSPIRREALRETEYSHVVLGGWAQDTRRATIEQDALKVIGLFPKGLSYDRYVIFGQRASTCHIFLHPLDSADAERNRFYLVQNAAGRRVQATGGDLIWVSPSRSPERRARNKITRAFLEKLEQLVIKAGTSCEKVGLEADWTKQVMWIADQRVCAPKPEDLCANPYEQVKASHFIDSGGLKHTHWFCVSRLSTILKLQLEVVANTLEQS